MSIRVLCIFVMAFVASIALPASALPNIPAQVPKKPALPTRFVDSPCAGCRAVFPATTNAVPVVVVLHGDWGVGASDLLTAWEHHALSRGVGVLSLQCPRDLGCKGSFWQWNGDPAWVNAQVDAVSSKHAIDREHLYIAGWSGGATYIGMRSQFFQRSFSALVYHGGGIAPFDDACGVQPSPDNALAPKGAAYFLTGTGNPLHAHVVVLKQHHERCKDDVVWRVLPKADHPAEWKALETNGGAIVDWLLTKTRAKQSGT